MKYYLKKVIRFLILSTTFVVLEFAVPFFSHSTNAAVFFARRDLMSARLITTPTPDRDICSLVSCAPQTRVVKTAAIRVTAYSSTPDQTSGNPFITASGAHVHSGTFALNGVPMGTKLRIPEYFGDKIFTVEDRMHSRYSSFRGDIWMETREEAIQWGARTVQVEFVEAI